GRPINSHHTFFFAAYEGSRTRQGTTFNYVTPTIRELAGDFSGGRPIYDPLTTRPNPAAPGQFLRDPFLGGIIPRERLSPPALYFRSLFSTPHSGEEPLFFPPPLRLPSHQ